MKKNNILYGAFALSVGSVLAKVFSAIYRIALTRILGGVGIGLYQLIFPFYSLCVVLATAGLPMAISKVISKNENKEVGVLKKCFLLTGVVALTLTLILFLSSKGIAKLQGQENIFLCYVILSPTIIVVSVASVLRGYFQGKHKFTPSAISNVVEQFVKLVFGLILSVSLISISLIASIIGAVVAIVLSEVVSLIVLLCFIKKERFNGEKTEDVSLKEIVKDVVPITLTNLVLPVSSFIDSLLVVNLLKFNFPNGVSVFLYGLESGAVSSLVTIPTIFSFSIASVILPNITNSKTNFEKSKSLTDCLKIVLLLTLPCVLSFIIIPERLIGILYGNRLNAYGYDGIKMSSVLLVISSFGILFLAISQVCSSCLQGVNKRVVTIRNLIVGISVKFALELIFLPSKNLNIYALAFANTFCYLIVMILNYLEIKQSLSFKIEKKFWVQLVVINLILIITLILTSNFLKGFVGTLFIVMISILVYVVSVFSFNVDSIKEKIKIKFNV